MDVTRLEQIEQMLKDEPGDLFLRYAHAMELQKAGRLEDCLSGLEQLMASDPPHVPSFFMAAQQLVSLEKIAAARTLLEEGIQHAQQQGNLHAAAEMGELLATLPAN